MLTGKDFEFLITHPDEFEILDKDFEGLMTPDDMPWSKILKNNWTYYTVGADEYYFSMEPPGIQMVFNHEMPYNKAKNIGDQIVEKLKRYSGLEIELILINSQAPLYFP